MCNFYRWYSYLFLETKSTFVKNHLYNSRTKAYSSSYITNTLWLSYSTDKLEHRIYIFKDGITIQYYKLKTAPNMTNCVNLLKKFNKVGLFRIFFISQFPIFFIANVQSILLYL